MGLTAGHVDLHQGCWWLEEGPWHRRALSGECDPLLLLLLIGIALHCRVWVAYTSQSHVDGVGVGVFSGELVLWSGKVKLVGSRNRL